MRRRIDREDIIKAGLKLIHLKGYGSTGIKDITEAVQIPKGSFYNHFPSKKAFGLEVLRYYEAVNLERLQQHLNDRRHTPITRIRRFFEDLATDFRTVYDYRYGCLAGNYSSELGDVSPAFATATLETLNKIRDQVIGCLDEAVEAGELPPHTETRELAEFITNSWQGALTKMKSGRHAYPLDTFIKFVFDRLLAADRA